MKWYAEYVGIPFRTLGREMSGCDCYGLVRIVLKDRYDIILPDLLEYTDSKNRSQTSKVISENIPLLSGTKLESPIEGSVVVMSESSGAVSSHIGIMVTDNLVLHTTYQTGAIIEPINNTQINKTIKGYYSVDSSYYTD